MRVISDNSIRRRDIRVELTWTDIQRLVVGAAAETVGLNEDEIGNLNVVIRQEEQGSPSYRVNRWSALVDLSVALDVPQ